MESALTGTLDSGFNHQTRTHSVSDRAAQKIEQVWISSWTVLQIDSADAAVPVLGIVEILQTQ